MFKLDDRVMRQLNSSLLSALMSRYPRRLLQLRQAITVAPSEYERALTVRAVHANGVATNYSVIYVWSVSLAQIIEVRWITISDLDFGLVEQPEAYV